MVDRLDCLDGLRGILALSVMFSHLIGSIIGWDDNRALVGAYLCVVYFFMMSGFVLSYAHQRKISILKYTLTRLARLLPLHLIALCLTISIFILNQKYGRYVPNQDVFDLSVIIKNALFANGIYWKEFYIINAPSWSISIEFWCSLLIPLFFNRMSLPIKIFLFLSCFCGLIFAYSGGFKPSISIAAVSMLVGNICFDLTKRKEVLSLLQGNYIEYFIVVSFLICAVGVYSENHSLRDFVYFLCFIPLLFIDYMQKSFFLKKILSSSFFRFLGFISFPLYLLHDIVIISGIIFSHSIYISILLGATLSIFISYFYARFIDIYMYKYLKSLIGA